MSTTERLYYEDSHLRVFDATVVDITERVSGWAGIVLDRTAFYPTGGGQPSDTGYLGGARVVECIDQEEKGVLHLIEGNAPQVGDRVVGKVDWPVRLDHMQQHTGQHILSQAFYKLYGSETRSFRVMQDASEVDIELENPSDERIHAAVELANEVIWSDRPLKVHNVTKEEATRMPLRKDSVREGNLRVIEISDFDLSPCGGTHALRTGEVGIIVVRSWERAKGMTRITFLAGGRVVKDYNRANSTARNVAAAFSAARDDGPALVARVIEENKQLIRRVNQLEEVAVQVEAEEILRDAEAVNGAKLISRVFDGRDAESLKRLALALVAGEPAVALLGSRDGETARLVFARSENAKGDMNVLQKEACAAIDGRGGGKPDMAQGGGKSVAKLEAVIEAAARSVKAECG
jgi:alanyl-tRNA synthetase